MLRPLLLTLLVAGSSAAWAADDVPLDDTRAEQLYENGARLYEEGLYEQAIEAFQVALKISGRPELHFNLANAYERVGNIDKAIEHLNRFRIYATGDQRTVVERRLRNLEARLATQTITPPDAAPARPEPVAAQPVTAPAKASPLKPILAISGGALLAIGGATATASYAQGKSYGNSKQFDQYDTMRTVNQVGLVGTGAGAALLITALIVPNKNVSVSPTPGGFLATSRWRF